MELDSEQQPGTAGAASNDTTNNNKEQCNRNFLLQQDVQAVVSEKGKEKVQSLLEQVYGLLPVEQLLLYLKLPTEHAGAADPLRQSMNPLGSRSEINQTIIWIQTHLEEDRELSLQKKGVYDEYVGFCEPNGIKPLSTADFGKVMKQVYPNVRPRRLGTRGQSKYCYSGLRSRVKLDAPMLPDLADKTLSTEADCTHAEYMAATWYIIKEWAEDKLSMQFKSAISLAYYLVKELSIAIGSEAAQIVTTLAASSDNTNENTHYGYISRHKETTMQLQRKIQQTKESKRKQLQSDRNEHKFRKKFKGSPPSTSCSTSPVVQMDRERDAKGSRSPPPNCDSANSLPDFNSFHRPPNANEPFAIEEPINSKRFPIGKAKQSPSKRSKNNKYKLIQAKPDYSDIATASSKVKKEELSFFPDEVSGPYFSRERLESVSQVSKDALDEYLGTSNSQEQEEEIIKYLGNHEEEKLTQLRELLVQNCPSTGFVATKGKMRAPSGGQSAAKRRVSFETTNIQRDEANFIPIGSPTGGKHSMCSSANASPFVSPRNTPIMRRSMHLPKNSKYRAEKLKRPNLELKLHEGGDFRHQMVNLPMSAPPSPKTYPYGKFYPQVQPNFAPQNPSDDASGLLPTNTNLFRSQSVPIGEQQLYNVFNYPSTNLSDLNDMMEMESLSFSRQEDDLKFPSRSVPNTPLPYAHPVDYQPQAVSSKSYPTTPLTAAADNFTYSGGSSDFLLNGQPIKDKHYLGGAGADGDNLYYSEADLIDANKNVNVGEAKSSIDELFKVVPE